MLQTGKCRKHNHIAHIFFLFSASRINERVIFLFFIVTVDVKKSYPLDFPIVNFLSNFASFIGFYFENQSQSWWVVVIWIMHARTQIFSVTSSKATKK